MSKEVYKYRIYCNTDHKWEYWVLESQVPPTTCPTNTNHTVNAISASLEEIISDKNVHIIKEDTPTQGYACSSTVTFDIPSGTPGAVSIFNKSFLNNMNIIGLEFESTADHEGDIISTHAYPEQIIGQIMSNALIGNSIIEVDDNVLTNIRFGFPVHISDYLSGNKDFLSSCTDIDYEDKTITVDIPPTKDYLYLGLGNPVNPFIHVSLKVYENYEIGPPQHHKTGFDQASTSYLAKGALVRVYYTNNSGTAKKLVVKFEHYY